MISVNNLLSMLAHLALFVLSIFLSEYATPSMSPSKGIFFTILIPMLYVLVGYSLTPQRTWWINLWSVSASGIVGFAVGLWSILANSWVPNIYFAAANIVMASAYSIFHFPSTKVLEMSNSIFPFMLPFLSLFPCILFFVGLQIKSIRK